MTFWTFYEAHPWLTLILAFVVVYIIETLLEVILRIAVARFAAKRDS